jgi:hypothetical protein
VKRIKATLGGETNAIQRETMRNERLGMATPKERKSNKKRKRLAAALHHLGEFRE